MIAVGLDHFRDVQLIEVLMYIRELVILSEGYAGMIMQGDSYRHLGYDEQTWAEIVRIWQAFGHGSVPVGDGRRRLNASDIQTYMKYQLRLHAQREREADAIQGLLALAK